MNKRLTVFRAGKEDDSNKENSIIGHVVNDLGGVLFAIELTNSVLDLASKCFGKNKFFQNSIKFVRTVTPIALTGHKIYSSVKKFQENHSDLSSSTKKSNKIISLLGIQRDYDLDYHEFNLGREILSWVLSSPKTYNFNILDFFNSEFEKITPASFDKGTLYILIEYNKSKAVMEVDLKSINDQLFVNSCYIHSEISWFTLSELRNVIFCDYLKFLDTSKNVIEINTRGLQTRPRKNLEFNISQFDVNKFKTEISNSIQKKKKRGYVLVGPPGVGKSTVILKLENQLKDIPIVYLTSVSDIYREDINNFFEFFRTISPCIVVFEDFDSYGLSKKNDKFFIDFVEQLDSLKHEECVIIIATLNEPENVHYSLLNRRGRFDKIFFIDYPKTKEEILSIFNNKFQQEKIETLFEDISDIILDKIISNKFTHSDICEIIQNILINEMEINDKCILESIEEIINSMKAIQSCNTKNDEPKENDEYSEIYDAI